MREVLIFRFIPCEGPGYLGHCLGEHDIPWRMICVDQGAPVPTSIDGVAGLVFMGGPMSVNDRLPWIETTLVLIRQAHERRLPLLGHCLGGQLIAKALGACVSANAVKEIGWWPVRVCDPVVPWVSALPPSFEAFQWHGETFSLPPGARHLFTSDTCVNQGFSSGAAIALQFHVEMLPDMVTTWAREYAGEIAMPTTTIQDEGQMHERLDSRIAASNRVAEVIYGHWLSLLE